MNRTTWKVSGLTLVLALALAGAVQAQQQQQHHRRGAQASSGQMSGETQASPAQAPMRQQMQGMMQQMQGMMGQMQDMMGQMPAGQGQGGMMGTPGMSAEDEDDEESMMGMMGRGGMMGHGHAMLRLLDRLAQQLDLSDEQETQVRALVRQHMKEAVQARADIAVQRIDLFALLDADSVDLSKVQETLQTIATQQADLMFAHISLLQEVNKLLTPEQQKQFRAMRSQMMHRKGGMMGRGGMHGKGGMMGHGGMHGKGGMMQRGGMMGREK